MLHEKVTVVLDNANNDFNSLYSSWPFRVWIIDENHRVAFKGMADADSGFDINLSRVRNWLRVLSNRQQQTQQKSCVGVKVEDVISEQEESSVGVLGEEGEVVVAVSDLGEE